MRLAGSRELSAYRTLIESALDKGFNTHNYEDVAAMVASGALQFWPGVASVICTEIIEHPRRRVANVFLAAGDLAQIKAMTPIIEDWAREHGCSLAVFAGRKGWEKTFLSARGWDARVWMAKEL